LARNVQNSPELGLEFAGFFNDRVKYDHSYIREWSLWLDVKILLKTALVVLRQEAAY
jgi:lipopolysaccharide/colanic/teichoic acid biosynthesis glycosyltransferase